MITHIVRYIDKPCRNFKLGSGIIFAISNSFHKIQVVCTMVFCSHRNAVQVVFQLIFFDKFFYLFICFVISIYYTKGNVLKLFHCNGSQCCFQKVCCSIVNRFDDLPIFKSVTFAINVNSNIASKFDSAIFIDGSLGKNTHSTEECA